MSQKSGCLTPVVFVLWILFIIAGVAGTGIFWFVPHVVPEAELERDSDGLFIVSPKNYDDWMTYSAVFSNINGKVGYGTMKGDFRVRVLPRLTSKAPARIQNAGNYRSSFHSVTAEGGDIVLVSYEDDVAISAWRDRLLEAARTHNDAVVDAGYDTRIRFDEPELDIDSVIEFGFWHDIEPWMRGCVAQGCPVNVKVEYSSTFFDGPNVTLVGSGLVVTRR
jgi:hypothetical protein